MRYSIAIASLLSSAALAAETVQFYFPGGPDGTPLSRPYCKSVPTNSPPPGSEGVDPIATIRKVSASTTEMNIACPTGVDSTECGWGPGLDYTIISATHYQAQMSAESVSMSFACDHNTAKSEMTCTVAMTGGDMDMAGPQTAVLSGSEVAFVTATVVAGAEKLSGADAQATAAPSSGAASAKSAPAAGSAAATGSGLMVDANPTATGSSMRTSKNATSSAVLPEHTGAATRFGLEASALFVLAGAMVANVL
jgi:hypothetical protein